MKNNSKMINTKRLSRVLNKQIMRKKSRNSNPLKRLELRKERKS